MDEQTEPLLENRPSSPFTFFILFCSVLICISAFLSGYNAACLNGPLANGTMIYELNMDSVDGEIATSMVNVGGMIGAFLCNYPANFFGRKKALLANNFFYIVGSVLCAATPAFWLLVVGRFLVGIGVGVASVLVPQLLSEIAAAEIRGNLTTLNQLLLTIGIFLAQVFYLILIKGHVKADWRYEVGIAIAPAILQIAMFFFIPESPSWLISKGRDFEAESLLKKLRPKTYDIQAELQTIKAAQEEADSRPASGGWKELFSMKKIVLIGIVSMAIQILTGINAVMYYSSKIFGFAGVSGDNSLYATLGVTGLNVVMTLVCNQLVDRLGRKPLLLGGLAAMFCSLVTAGFVLLFVADQDTGGIVSIVMILIYVAGFAIGLGAVLWPLLGEIFPNSTRSQGMSLCLLVNWALNLLITFFTLSLIDGFGGVKSDDPPSVVNQKEKKGAAYLFLLFAGISLLGWLFIAFLVPETKGKSLEEIQEILNGKPRQQEQEDFKSESVPFTM